MNQSIKELNKIQKEFDELNSNVEKLKNKTKNYPKLVTKNH